MVHISETPVIRDPRGKKLNLYKFELKFPDRLKAGDSVWCRLMVVSGTTGYFFMKGYFGIKYNGKDCRSRHNVRFTRMKYDDLDCTFKMPDKDTKVTFYGGHAEGGRWVEDFSRTELLKRVVKPPKPPVKPPVKPPKIPPKKRCTQKFWVKDEYRRSLRGVTISVSGVGKTTTGRGGWASMSLGEGVKYTATAEKSGYECLDCRKDFAACKKTVVLSLKKEKVVKIPKIPVPKIPVKPPVKPPKIPERPPKPEPVPGFEWYWNKAIGAWDLREKKKPCTQRFKVVDEKGVPIREVTLSIGLLKRITDGMGRASMGYSAGVAGTTSKVKAEKSGYECITCEKTFTACEKEIVLTLKKKVAPLPPAKKPPVIKKPPEIKICDQSIKVIDEKREPISKSAVTIVGVGKKFTGADGIIITKLMVGKDYIATAKKREYECAVCKKSFVACEREVILSLKKAVPKEKLCTQPVGARDERGGKLAGVLIRARTDGIIKKCTTNSSGNCTLSNLVVGKTYTLEAIKEGYIFIDKKTFKACTRRRIYLNLSLKRRE